MYNSIYNFNQQSSIEDWYHYHRPWKYITTEEKIRFSNSWHKLLFWFAITNNATTKAFFMNHKITI